MPVTVIPGGPLRCVSLNAASPDAASLDAARPDEGPDAPARRGVGTAGAARRAVAAPAVPVAEATS